MRTRRGGNHGFAVGLRFPGASNTPRVANGDYAGTINHAPGGGSATARGKSHCEACRLWRWCVMAGGRMRTWVAALGGAALLTVFTTLQAIASRRVEGLSADWQRILTLQGIDWFAWALLVPPLLAAAARLHWNTARVRFVTSWVGLSGLASIAHTFLEVSAVRTFGLIGAAMGFGTQLSARWSATFVASILVVTAIVATYYAAHQARLAYERAQHEVELESQLVEAKLNVLRNQLQPHFLFNTLHSISALMTTDVDAARRAIVQLGDLLRWSLETLDRHELTVQEEVRALHYYLEIQQVRFGQRLRAEVIVGPEVMSAAIPTFLLQPLVENSVRYAVEPRSAGGHVAVTISRGESSLVVVVDDDGAPSGSQPPPGLGIGLANTRARLHALYGDRFTLAIEDNGRGGGRTRLIIPFRETR